MAEKKGWSVKGIGLKGENLNIADLIGRQMDRVLQSLGMGKDEFFNQLEGLEAVCELVGTDDEYDMELKEINSDFREEKKKARAIRKPIGGLTVGMGIKRFRAISKRIKRSGIAPKEEVDLILE